MVKHSGSIGFSRANFLVAAVAAVAVILSFTTVARLTVGGGGDRAFDTADPRTIARAQLAPLAERLEARLARDRADAQAWKALAIVRERLGQRPAALAAYLEAARREPSDREVTLALRRLALTKKAD